MTAVSDATPDRATDGQMLRDEVILALPGADRRPIHGQWATAAAQRLAPAERVEIRLGDLTRHLGVLGQTGTGKTVGVLLPAVRRLIELGCAGMALETKGDFLHLAEAFPDRVRILGLRGAAVNVIASLSDAGFHAWLTKMTPVSKNNGPYWGTIAVQAAVFARKSLRLMLQREPTLAEITDAILAPKAFVEAFEPWVRTQSTLPEPYARDLRTMVSNPMGLLAQGGYGGHEPRAAQAEQWGYHINHLIPMLRPFASDPVLRERLSAATPLDFQALLYDERCVVIPDFPAEVFGPQAGVIGGLLREQMMTAITGYPFHRRDGLGETRFTFLAVDEFQEHIQLEPPLVSGATNDNDWLERSRSYGHINLLASQGGANLAAALPEAQRGAPLDALFTNLGTVVAMHSPDRESVRVMSNRSAGVDQEHITSVLAAGLGRGEALVQGSQLAAHGGPVTARVRTGHVPGYPHMGVYLDGIPEAPLLAAPDCEGQQRVDNPEFAAPAADVEGEDFEASVRELLQAQLEADFIRRHWDTGHGVRLRYVRSSDPQQRLLLWVESTRPESGARAAKCVVTLTIGDFVWSLALPAGGLHTLETLTVAEGPSGLRARKARITSASRGELHAVAQGARPEFGVSCPPAMLRALRVMAEVGRQIADGEVALGEGEVERD